jgi:hypothetical protein
MLAESERVRLKILLESRLDELNVAFQNADDRLQQVEFDQSRDGRLSRMDTLQQQARSDAARDRATRERVSPGLVFSAWATA